MNVKNLRWGMIAAGLVGVAGISPVSAELPTLTEKEWLGYFVGFKNRAFQFGISSEGKTTIKVIGKKGEPVANDLTVSVNFLISETMPDGKVVERKIQTETLESAQPATDKPQNIVLRGKVTGDASFEVFVNEEHGGISLGGRMLDAGKLKNPARFSIALKFPNAYAKAKKTGDAREARAFEEKTKKDKLQLIWTDKKRVKFPASDKIDVASKEVNGPGIAAAQLEISSYDEKRFEITASENSVLTLSNASGGPLNEGFLLNWTADPAKDPEAKARLSIKVQ